MIGSAADIDFMLSEVGVPVTIGDVSGFGIFEASTSFGFTEGLVEVQEKSDTLLVRTGYFPVSRFKLSLIDGAQFQIRSSDPQDDGAMTLLSVART